MVRTAAVNMPFPSWPSGFEAKHFLNFPEHKQAEQACVPFLGLTARCLAAHSEKGPNLSSRDGSSQEEPCRQPQDGSIRRQQNVGPLLRTMRCCSTTAYALSEYFGSASTSHGAAVSWQASF